MKNELENNLNVLISFRSIDEVSEECLKYVDILDLKDPDKGAIGSWEINNLKKIRHGIQTQLEILNHDFLFKDVPNTINIGHYHSWVIKNVPKQLKVTALDFENFPMAFRHTDLKISGIQFHPESILTDYGKQILQNWIIS